MKKLVNIIQINEAVAGKFHGYRVTADKNCDIRLEGDLKEADFNTARVFAFIFCTFPAVETIAFGGCYTSRDVLLRFAYNLYEL